MDQLITPLTNEELTDRAWLLGKMQTSLMRDGWGVTNTDPEEGVLDIVDGIFSFKLTLTAPARAKPAPAAPIKKSTSAKRKR